MLSSSSATDGCSPWPTEMARHAPFGQRLLLVDAHVEEHGLHPQQHAALDLPGQGVKQGARQGDPHVIKPSLKCRRRGGSGLRQGDARQASKERKALLASGRDSGLAQLRDLLAAGHRPVQGCEMSVAGWDEHFQLNATE